MSDVIDNRVVRMEFDNASFEKNAKESIDTLKKVDEALEFKNGARSFKEVEEAAEKTNFSSLLTACETVSSKLSNLGIVGITALQNITNKAVDAGERFAKSLSTDQITAGWQKYEQKTSYVQTIMNATGASMEEVDKWLGKLMWYSDETSYSFTEMLNSYATMLSSGTGDANDLISVITGIGNAVSFAGKGAAEMNSALRYSFNQAMSKGYMLSQDYSTLQTQALNSKQLNQSFIDAAQSLGILDEEFRTVNGTMVTAENISSTLYEKWLTSDVMVLAFKKWADYSDAVYETTQVLEEYGTTAEAMEKLSGQFEETAEKGFQAAQQSKSFGDAVNAIKDAVSTGWMSTFETIFGDLEHQIELWGELYEVLYPIFVEGGNRRNSMLSEWAKLGGRDSALNGLFNLISAIWDRVTALREGFEKIFPPTTAQQLKDISDRFYEWSERIQMSEEEGRRLTSTGEKLASVLKTILGAAKSAAEAARSLLSFGKRMGKAALELKPVAKTIELLKEGISGLGKGITSGFGLLERGFGKLKELLDGVGAGGKRFVETAESISSAASTSGNSIDKIGSRLSKFLKPINSVLDRLKNIFGKVTSWASPVLNGVLFAAKKFATGFKTWVIEPISDFINKIVQSNDRIGAFKEGLHQLGAYFTGAMGRIGTYVQRIDFSKWKEKLAETFSFAREEIDKFIEKVKEKSSDLDMSSIFAGMAGLTAIVAVGKFTEAIDQIGLIAENIKLTFTNINKLIKSKYAGKFATNIRSLASSILMVATSMLALNKIPTGKMWSIAGVIAALSTVMSALSVWLMKTAAGLSPEKLAGLVKVGGMMILLALAVKMLVKAMTKLASIEFDSVWDFFGALVYSVGLIAGSAWALSLALAKVATISGPITVGIAAIIGMALALAVMAAVVSAAARVVSGAGLLRLLGLMAVVGIVALAMLGLSALIRSLVGANTVLAITGFIASLAMIVGAAYLITKMPSDLKSIGKILAYLAGALGVIAIIVAILRKAARYMAVGREMTGLAVGIAILGGSIAIMVGVFKRVVKMGLTEEQVSTAKKVMWAVTLMVGSLAVLMGIGVWFLNDSKGFVKMGLALIMAVGAIAGLVGVVKLLGKTALEDLWQGLVVIGIIGAVIAGVTAVAANAAEKGKITGLLYILGIGAIIAGLTWIAIKLSELAKEAPLNQVLGTAAIITGIGIAIALILVGLGKAAQLADKSGGSSGWRSILALIGAAVITMGAIAGMAMLINTIGGGKVWNAFGVFAAVLAYITIIAALMSQIKISKAKVKNFGILLAELAGLMAVFGIFAYALRDVAGGRLVGQIGILLLAVAGIALIAGILGAPGLGLAVKSGALALLTLSGAFALACVGIIAFAAAMAILNKLDLPTIGRGLREVISGLSGIGLVGVGMIIAGAGAAALGIGFVILGAGLWVLQPRIERFLPILAQLIALLGKDPGTRENARELAAAFGEEEKAAKEAAKASKDTVEQITELNEAADNAAESTANVIDDSVNKTDGKLKKGATSLIDGIKGMFNAIGYAKDEITGDSLASMIEGGLSNIAGDNGVDWNSLGSIIGIDVEGLTAQAGELFGGIGSESGEGFISGLTDGGVLSNLTGAAGDIGATVTDGIESADYRGAGINAINGLISGLLDKAANMRLARVSADVGRNNILANINGSLDINSPSGETEKSGIYAIAGLVNGLSDRLWLGKLAKTSGMVGVSMVNALNSEIQNDGTGIRPVLDMSEVYSQLAMMDDGTWRPVIKPVLDMSGVNPGMMTAEAAMYARNGYGPEAAGRAPVSTTQTISPVFYIYGSEGQSVDELADVVMNKMESAYAVKAGVFR